MTPPVAPAQGQTGRVAEGQPAVFVCPDGIPGRIETLRHRPDFLRAAQGRRQGTPGFLLQARKRGPEEATAPGLLRVGFTCSRKVGNAVARNRARRRLREIARSILPQAGCPGWDYVLVGRPEATVTRDFAALRDDLRRALSQIHRDLPPDRDKAP
jgi:ribonuclease P protein component